MRKILMLLGVVVALAIPAAALAATLDTGKFTDFIDKGSKCSRAPSTTSFNQARMVGRRDAHGGLHQAQLRDGTTSCARTEPGQRPRTTSCSARGKLVTAEDDISAGKLVISGVVVQEVAAGGT